MDTQLETRYTDDFGSRITLISHAISQSFNRLFQAHNLTYPQSRVLTYLFDHEDHPCINQRELERALGLKASSVSSLVVTLEQKGFLSTSRTVADARSKQIVLTGQARQLQSVLTEAGEAIEARLSCGIEGEEKEIVSRALEQMIHNLLDPAEPAEPAAGTPAEP